MDERTIFFSLAQKFGKSEISTSLCFVKMKVKCAFDDKKVLTVFFLTCKIRFINLRNKET